ncbi:MAG TPA: nuclear transport factor 2 family protein [Ferruginibacter sp.]|jgi:hypothetical protein|nr:nuclear transport factor 2 family protein [Ferruginibacter sp.]
MDTQPAGSTIETFDIDRFKALYKTFDSNTLEQLPNLYSEEVSFKDPIHQIHGLADLRQYFARFCSPDTYCSFEFMNQVVTCDQAFFHWQMHYSHPQLEHGRQLSLNGGSLIRFNNLITHHEDFYDMGAMIYTHVPVMGWVVKKINARLISD